MLRTTAGPSTAMSPVNEVPADFIDQWKHGRKSERCQMWGALMQRALLEQQLKRAQDCIERGRSRHESPDAIEALTREPTVPK